MRGLILGLTALIYSLISDKYWPNLNKFVSGLIAAFLVISVYLILNKF